MTDGTVGTGVDGFEPTSDAFGIVRAAGSPFWMFAAYRIPARRVGRPDVLPEVPGTAALTEPRWELPLCGKEATPDAPT